MIFAGRSPAFFRREEPLPSLQSPRPFARLRLAHFLRSFPLPHPAGKAILTRPATPACLITAEAFLSLRALSKLTGILQFSPKLPVVFVSFRLLFTGIFPHFSHNTRNLPINPPQNTEKLRVNHFI